MTRRDTHSDRGMDGGHFSEARMAEFATGTTPIEAERSHLVNCRQCSAVIAELVRVRAEDTLQRPAAPDQIVALGHEFIRTRVSAREHTVAAAPTHKFPRRRVLRWAPAVAAAAVLFVMVGQMFSPSSEYSAEVPESIRSALIADSSYGLVHPFVSAENAFIATVFRGGETVRESPVHFIDELQADLIRDPDQPSVLMTLIASFQATNQLRNARTYIDDARIDYPDSKCIHMLNAVQRYLEGDLAESRSILEEILSRDSDDELARLNLAILLSQSNSEDMQATARAMANKLLDSLDDGGLAQRAREIAG